MFGRKNWFQSLTAWGLILFGAAQAAEQTGVLPPGTSANGQETTNAIVAAVTSIGALLAALGIRKAATAPNDG